MKGRGYMSEHLGFYDDGNAFISCLKGLKRKRNVDNEIRFVKLLQELAESESKACPKHRRERWANIS